jgi:tetratricopeptide (TPR) repeat protein
MESKRSLIWLLLLTIKTQTAKGWDSGGSQSPITQEDLLLPSSNTTWADKQLQKAIRLIVDGDSSQIDTINSIFQDVIRAEPKNFRAHGELARFQLWLAVTGKADPSTLASTIQIARQSMFLSEKHNSPFGSLVMAECLLSLGQMPLAQYMMTDIRQKYPGNPDLLVFDIRIKSISDPEMALRLAQEALAKGVELDSISSAISTALSKIPTSLTRSEVFWNFAKVYPDRWLTYKAGILFLEEGRLDQAKRALKVAEALGNHLEAPFQLGTILYRLENQPELAKIEFLKVANRLRREGGWKHPLFAMSYGHLALVEASTGNWEKSQKYASLLVDVASTQDSFLSGFLELYLTQAPARKVIPLLHKLVETTPTLAIVHNTLGRLAYEDGNYIESLSYFKNAVVLKPGAAELFSAQGHAHYKLKDYSQALKEFDRAIALEPSLANHYYNKACMLALLGRKQEAIKNLEHAFDRNKALWELAKSDNDLKSVQEDTETVGLWKKLQSQFESTNPVSDLESEVVPASR